MRHRRHDSRHPLVAGIVALGLVVLAAGPAGASWIGLGSGGATSRAGSLPIGSTPIASVAGQSVTVSWPAVTLPGGGTPGGYNVVRYAGGIPQATGASCAGLITTTSCTETAVAGGTYTYRVRVVRGAWLGSTGAASNAVTVVTPDTTPPTISAVAAVKTAGGDGNRLRQGGTYHVYASVTDPGSPATGVASVTTNASSLTAGATAVTMTAGSYPLNGVTYTHRSAVLTVTNPSSEGIRTISVAALDGAGNPAGVPGHQVAVDNTAPATVDVQTVNTGAIVGQAEPGDRLVLTYSEPVDANSVLAGWTGSATPVTVRIVNIPAGNDGVEIWNAANSTEIALGRIDLGGKKYRQGSVAQFTASTMVRTGNVVTITLGTLDGSVGQATTPGTMTWTPLSGQTDWAGNALPTTVRAESGAADLEF